MKLLVKKPGECRSVKRTTLGGKEESDSEVSFKDKSGQDKAFFPGEDEPVWPLMSSGSQYSEAGV